jgi:hypothetical protein
MLKNIVVAAALLSSLSLTAIQPADAQVVRRHLHCAIVPNVGFSGGGFAPTITTVVQATNNWTTTIPKGTKFSYRVNGRYYTFTSTKALAPGGKMLLGDARGASACQDVWIPG